MQNEEGFTLLEMLLVMVVITVLLLLIIPNCLITIKLGNKILKLANKE
ncbi:hypothetical protein BC2926_01810 [Bacillus cereus]|nr:hypothetical protein BC2926_01810 [Bacillus cereus]